LESVRYVKQLLRAVIEGWGARDRGGRVYRVGPGNRGQRVWGERKEEHLSGRGGGGRSA